MCCVLLLRGRSHGLCVHRYIALMVIVYYKLCKYSQYEWFHIHILSVMIRYGKDFLSMFCNCNHASPNGGSQSRHGPSDGSIRACGQFLSYEMNWLQTAGPANPVNTEIACHTNEPIKSIVYKRRFVRMWSEENMAQAKLTQKIELLKVNRRTNICGFLWQTALNCCVSYIVKL